MDTYIQWPNYQKQQSKFFLFQEISKTKPKIFIWYKFDTLEKFGALGHTLQKY